MTQVKLASEKKKIFLEYVNEYIAIEPWGKIWYIQGQRWISAYEILDETGFNGKRIQY